ncbi:helix-turn-helix transcriptional regulator [Candidatus Chloroploca sp. M-50]|uniref:Helix-turn-helix transcriptional regulator n=1 Tax=Candidatus Chloroploca mongolica TaxID=2528176 RepID=A0ABS4DFA3_9CHLR|nr:AraC family transcriptional regulator [Candidatus Chloroploca mongolica]MBP1468106.1 helix-turn-helix transcriptional regulator [Candidatus Chloroploca mongolica]
MSNAVQAPLVSSTDFDLDSIAPHQRLTEDSEHMPDGIHVFGATFVHRDLTLQLPMHEQYIITGPLQAVVDLRGTLGRPFHTTLRPGTIHIVPRGEPAAYHYRCQETPTMGIIYLAPRVLAQVAHETLDGDPNQVNLLPRTAEPDAFLYELCRAFLDELMSGSVVGKLYLEALTQTLAIHLLRQHSTMACHTLARAEAQPDLRLRRVLEFIDTHLHQTLTLGEIAAAAHLSQYHLGRVFKRAMGMSLHQYLIAQRVERGRALLERGEHTVREVAARVGFADHSHFNLHFKRRYGISPSAVTQKRTIFHR